jgi:hypothetical protein
MPYAHISNPSLAIPRPAPHADGLGNLGTPLSSLQLISSQTC